MLGGRAMLAIGNPLGIIFAAVLFYVLFSEGSKGKKNADNDADKDAGHVKRWKMFCWYVVLIIIIIAVAYLKFRFS